MAGCCGCFVIFFVSLFVFATCGALIGLGAFLLMVFCSFLITLCGGQ